MKEGLKMSTTWALILSVGVFFAGAVGLSASELTRTDESIENVPAFVAEAQLVAAGDWMQQEEGEQESEAYREPEGERYEGYEEPVHEGYEEPSEGYESEESEQEYDAPTPRESWEESSW